MFPVPQPTCFDSFLFFTPPVRTMKAELKHSAKEAKYTRDPNHKKSRQYPLKGDQEDTTTSHIR